MRGDSDEPEQPVLVDASAEADGFLPSPGGTRPDTLAARFISAGSICAGNTATCLAAIVAKQACNGSEHPLSYATRIGLPPGAFGTCYPSVRDGCPDRMRSEARPGGD